jgi:DNA-binding NtrC family response regulator
LNVLAIPVPALRDRQGDIVPLALHFLDRLGPVHGRSDATLSGEAQQLLEAHAWPGNVRELKNAIEHALVFAKQPLLDVADFPQVARSARNGRGAAGLKSLEELERETIQTTLEALHYKFGEAASILGISRKTLLDKRKKFGLV